ncbi:hypothetical protein FRC16_004607 [Serendipita sp. 398]|nr:hypothetical protein FRC16_004607 [Serendipita sp. 398]
MNNSLGKEFDLYANISREPKRWGMTLPISHVDSFKDLLSNLSTFGTVATFLAAVQAQVLAFSIDNQSSTLKSAATALFFSGLFFDVTGASISLLGITQVQRLHTILLRRTNAVTSIANILERSEPQFCHDLQYLHLLLLLLLSNIGAWNKWLSEYISSSKAKIDELDTNNREQCLSYILEYETTDMELESLQFGRSRLEASLAFFAHAALPVIVLGGLLSFVAGALCLVIAAQPVGVWVTSLAIVVVLALSSATMIMRGAWSPAPRRTIHRI